MEYSTTNVVKSNILISDKMEYSKIYEFFFERHIALNDDWLECAIKFIDSKKVIIFNLFTNEHLKYKM